jgi:hypothetical protein
MEIPSLTGQKPGKKGVGMTDVKGACQTTGQIVRMLREVAWLLEESIPLFGKGHSTSMQS